MACTLQRCMDAWMQRKVDKLSELFRDWQYGRWRQAKFTGASLRIPVDQVKLPNIWFLRYWIGNFPLKRGTFWRTFGADFRGDSRGTQGRRDGHDLLSGKKPRVAATATNRGTWYTHHGMREARRTRGVWTRVRMTNNMTQINLMHSNNIWSTSMLVPSPLQINVCLFFI